MYYANAKLVALTYDLFLARIRQVLSGSSLDGRQVGSHSWRRGGASHCYAIGLSAESIKLIGDWSSSCFMRYIDNDFQTKFNIVTQMQKGV